MPLRVLIYGVRRGAPYLLVAAHIFYAAVSLIVAKRLYRMIGRLGGYTTFGFDFPGSDEGDDTETLAEIKICNNLGPLL
ncbi:hypothetical protein Y032_0054g2470 [Ancylostoma ceylanicum]|uniref:Uncharacterized protein n=1 Tax=Ancylostoma ceylanicum TaxID=53326 RepID=A0A016U6T8_9BILA|nr:hypothetical protein Y032_0054g2470 [Ancylostoma ceylanicum]